MLIVLLHSASYCTDQGLEIIMLFFNQVLMMTNHTYRFPVRVATFVLWAQLNKRVYPSLKSYVCCTNCHALYQYNQPVAASQKCSWKDSLKNAKPCHNELFSTIKNKVHISKRLFHYNPIASTLQIFLKRPYFVHQLEGKRRRVPGLYSDIQHGQMFRNFKIHENDVHAFVDQSPYNILISIFVDWFQLFDDNSQDLGGIYATVQNIFPSERHLKHNSITIGIMGGPKEASYLHIGR